ncbi:MAG: hypothetical protein V4598_06590 [Bdellovibrionota bacterium]
MKKLILLTLMILASCSGPTPKKEEIPTVAPGTVTGESLEELKAEDERILSGLHEEAQKQGKVQKKVENGITAEIWSWSEEHGSNQKITETLLYKKGKLISHTLMIPSEGFTGSRQFVNDKVIQVSEEWKNRARFVYLDENEKIKGRIHYRGKESECIVYDAGVPRYEKVEVCEAKFNTAP